MAEYVRVSTNSGTLVGVTGPRGAVFLGVPYGAVTGGAGRFRPPTPPCAWSGERPALTFRPVAPQPDSRIGAGPNEALLALLYQGDGSATEGFGISEDCLHLNLWTPSCPTQDDEREPLPVMVWLHGGGFQSGCGNEAAIRGANLAKTANAIVVTVTHRLGALGFAAFDEDDSTGNAGLLDIVQALNWVHDNIAAFGGDPTSVTVFGQSGGGMKALALTSMPSASGLYHRLIVQSGPLLAWVDREAALDAGRRLREACGASSLQELRGLPLDRIVAAMPAVHASLGIVGQDLIDRFASGMWPGPSSQEGILTGPSLGGGLPVGADVPLLIGWNTHDMALMTSGDPDYLTLTTDGGRRKLEASCPAALDRFEQILADGVESTPQLAMARALTELTFKASSLEVARRWVGPERPACHVYRFDQPTDAWAGTLGACHSVELAYVFGTTATIPFTGSLPTRDRVASTMMTTWGRFARDGSPEIDGGPSWPEFTGDGGHAMVLGPNPHVEEVDL